MYLAPGGAQMKLEAGSRGAVVLRLTDDLPENGCKPAVDYLFLFRRSFNFPGDPWPPF